MTVREYLLFAAELKRIPKKEQKDQLAKAIALAHLEDAEGRLIRNLSKGYRQRVGLAQAILGFPKVIILDEPTVGLDPRQVVEIRDVIRQLAADHTVIISSHILSEMRAICDRVLIIRKGKLVACDTPARLEEALSAGSAIELLAKGSQSAVEAILDTVPGITDRSVTAQADGTVRIVLSTETDSREVLFLSFAAAGVPLLELRIRNASLEEIFLDLTAEDDTLAEKAARLLTGQPAQTAEKGGEDA